MKNLKNSIVVAKETILMEGNAISNLVNFVDENFEKAVACILASKGRIIVTGIGKSANIAAKIVATFNSTGTPSIFMHAADAIHGDLGMIQNDDMVVCISKSGNTAEIKVLIPLIKNSKNKIIAITGNSDSFLANHADFILNSYVEKEACPNNLTPTTSTTAQLVIGDALAVCLLKLRAFSKDDFAKYHPGGALGKRLYLKVSDVIKQNQLPKVNETCTVAKVIVEITEKRLGATAVLSENGKISGIITDGDIRRMLATQPDITNVKAKDIMGRNPKIISCEAMAIAALETMESNNISQILITDSYGNYTGVIHLHDLIKEGIF